MSNDTLPHLDADCLQLPLAERLSAKASPDHRPRILLLYGSNREQSYSRLLTLEAERLFQHLGAETRVYHPVGLPLPDDAPVVSVDRDTDRLEKCAQRCGPFPRGTAARLAGFSRCCAADGCRVGRDLDSKPVFAAPGPR